MRHLSYGLRDMGKMILRGITFPWLLLSLTADISTSLRWATRLLSGIKDQLQDISYNSAGTMDHTKETQRALLGLSNQMENLTRQMAGLVESNRETTSAASKLLERRQIEEAHQYDPLPASADDATVLRFGRYSLSRRPSRQHQPDH